MATEFDALEIELSRAVNDVLAERIAITPRAGGEYAAPVADPARPAFETRGIPSVVPVTTGLAGQQPENALRGPTRLLQAAREVWISPEEAAKIAVEIRRGDLLVLADRPGTPAYAIAAVERPQTGELRLTLTLEDVLP